MTSLFSLLSFIDTPVNAHNFVSDVNDTESGLPMNRTLATFVLTTALNLEFGCRGYKTWQNQNAGNIAFVCDLRLACMQEGVK
jgi:hypothetical protein